MTLDQIEKICDKEGFWVNKYDDMYGEGKPGWEIGQMSSCGEDWFETFEADDVDTFIANLESRIDNWDSEEEAMPYIERRGQNGVPSSIRDLLDDADWKVEQLKDLLDAIKEAPDEENEIEESKKQEWKETSSDEFGDIETNKYYEIEVDDGFLDDRFDSECMEFPIFKYYDPLRMFQRITCASNEDIVRIKEMLIDRANRYTDNLVEEYSFMNNLKSVLEDYCRGKENTIKIVMLKEFSRDLGKVLELYKPQDNSDFIQN